MTGYSFIHFLVKDFLIQSVPSLSRWIHYMLQTQSSTLPHAYRWHGRTSTHCLASGLDDYPRHTLNTPNEGHVDLLAWAVFSLDTLAEIEEGLGLGLELGLERERGKEGVTQSLRKEAEMLRERLLAEYWDAESHFFSDLGMVEKRVDNGHGSEHEEMKREVGFECHVGYVTLLPFALQLLDVDDPRVGEILDVIEDPEQVGMD